MGASGRKTTVSRLPKGIDAMSPTKKIYTTKNEKTIDFVIGFVAWFVLNGVLTGLTWFMASMLGTLQVEPEMQSVLGIVGAVVMFVPLVINIGLLIFFAFTRAWIALGMLAAFGVSLLITICLGILFGAACFAILYQYEQYGFHYLIIAAA